MPTTTRRAASTRGQSQTSIASTSESEADHHAVIVGGSSRSVGRRSRRAGDTTDDVRVPTSPRRPSRRPPLAAKRARKSAPVSASQRLNGSLSPPAPAPAPAPRRAAKKTRKTTKNIAIKGGRRRDFTSGPSRVVDASDGGSSTASLSGSELEAESESENESAGEVDHQVTRVHQAGEGQDRAARNPLQVFQDDSEPSAAEEDDPNATPRPAGKAQNMVPAPVSLPELAAFAKAGLERLLDKADRELLQDERVMLDNFREAFETYTAQNPEDASQHLSQPQSQNDGQSQHLSMLLDLSTGSDSDEESQEDTYESQQKRLVNIFLLHSALLLSLTDFSEAALGSLVLAEGGFLSHFTPPSLRTNPETLHVFVELKRQLVLGCRLLNLKNEIEAEQAGVEYRRLNVGNEEGYFVVDEERLEKVFGVHEDAPYALTDLAKSCRAVWKEFEEIPLEKLAEDHPYSTFVGLAEEFIGTCFNICKASIMASQPVAGPSQISSGREKLLTPLSLSPPPTARKVVSKGQNAGKQREQREDSARKSRSLSAGATRSSAVQVPESTTAHRQDSPDGGGASASESEQGDSTAEQAHLLRSARSKVESKRRHSESSHRIRASLKSSPQTERLRQDLSDIRTNGAASVSPRKRARDSLRPPDADDGDEEDAEQSTRDIQHMLVRSQSAASVESQSQTFQETQTQSQEGVGDIESLLAYSGESQEEDQEEEEETAVPDAALEEVKDALRMLAPVNGIKAEIALDEQLERMLAEGPQGEGNAMTQDVEDALLASHTQTQRSLSEASTERARSNEDNQRSNHDLAGNMQAETQDVEDALMESQSQSSRMQYEEEEEEVLGERAHAPEYQTEDREPTPQAEQGPAQQYRGFAIDKQNRIIPRTEKDNRRPLSSLLDRQPDARRITMSSPSSQSVDQAKENTATSNARGETRSSASRSPVKDDQAGLSARRKGKQRAVSAEVFLPVSVTRSRRRQQQPNGMEMDQVNDYPGEQSPAARAEETPEDEQEESEEAESDSDSDIEIVASTAPARKPSAIVYKGKKRAARPSASSRSAFIDSEAEEDDGDCIENSDEDAATPDMPLRSTTRAKRQLDIVPQYQDPEHAAQKNRYRTSRSSAGKESHRLAHPTANDKAKIVNAQIDMSDEDRQESPVAGPSSRPAPAPATASSPSRRKRRRTSEEIDSDYENGSEVDELASSSDGSESDEEVDSKLSEKQKRRYSEHRTPGKEADGARGKNGAKASSSGRKRQETPSDEEYDQNKKKKKQKGKGRAAYRYSANHGRMLWSQKEDDCFLHALEKMEDPHMFGRWGYILRRHGKNGTISQTLKHRTNVNLKDRARTIQSQREAAGYPALRWYAPEVVLKNGETVKKRTKQPPSKKRRGADSESD